jgi:cadmium resistance protein CadD (predicted permease)
MPVTRGALSVGVVMIANSSDSFAAFVPLFAETREPFTFLIVAVGAGLSLAWCWLARWITSHASVQRPLQTWGAYVLPIMLILVGTYILTDTGTDTV